MSSLSTALSSVPRPMSDSSSLLRALNSDANDALLLYAKHFGKISEATSAILTSIDLHGFQLRVTYRNVPPSSPASGPANGSTPLSPTALRTSAVTTVKIQFKKPLTVIDEAATVLTDMYSEARAASPAHSNAPHAPHQNSSSHLLERRFHNAFTMKPVLSFSLLFGLVALYVIAFYSPSELPFPVLFRPLQAFGLFLLRTTAFMKFVHYAAWIAHTCEAAYSYILLKELHMDGDVVDTVKWVAQTFILGFPSLTILTKIKHQMKKQQKKTQ